MEYEIKDHGTVLHLDGIGQTCLNTEQYTRQCIKNGARIQPGDTLIIKREGAPDLKVKVTNLMALKPAFDVQNLHILSPAANVDICTLKADESGPDVLKVDFEILTD